MTAAKAKSRAAQRRIADIIVGIRHRRDLGDIDSLARSIAEVGLLHPVVIRPDGVLIAGARRLAACRALGWSKVPVRIMEPPNE
jgi:ParB family chromosome partitioning protein